jgi:uncharacterized protein YbjQ (UPF0145 family)
VPPRMGGGIRSRSTSRNSPPRGRAITSTAISATGANAVIAMRFDSSEISQQLTEIVAYGTAVVVRPTG